MTDPLTERSSPTIRQHLQKMIERREQRIVALREALERIAKEDEPILKGGFFTNQKERLYRACEIARQALSEDAP